MWGETAHTEETHSYTFSYRDKNGYQPNTQVCRDVTYPFSSIPVVLSTWNITNNGVKAWRPSGSSAVLVQHYAKDGNDLKDWVNPWKFANTAEMNPSTDKDKLKAHLHEGQ